MKAKIRTITARLFATYWFLPSLMAVLAAGLSLLTVRVDQAVEGRITGLFWLYAGGPEGARILLSTVAGSMITVAGVVERPERKEAIRRQGDMIKRAGDRLVEEKLDQKEILERYRSLKRILDAD
jgi:uncharacterized membrane protein